VNSNGTRKSPMESQEASCPSKKRPPFLATGTNLVLLSPDVARHFPDTQSVNSALRTLIRAAKRTPRRSRELGHIGTQGNQGTHGTFPSLTTSGAASCFLTMGWGCFYSSAPRRERIDGFIRPELDPTNNDTGRRSGNSSGLPV
jgi:hypothetical protein